MIEFNRETCNACGLCADICPRRVFEHDASGDEKVTSLHPERIDICIDCGHCMAVCATDSIRIQGIDPAGFHKAPSLATKPEELLAILRHRRTIRRYKDEPVPREILGQIAEAAQLAPTPTCRPVGVTVLDTPETLAELSGHVYALYEKMLGADDSFFGRMVLKRKLGEQKLTTLEQFVIPGLRWYVRWYREGSSDEVRRDSPALMLFHAPLDEPEGDACCMIAATYAVLMAETLGVGSCINGLIPAGCNRSADAQRVLGLPDNHEVFAALTLGYPRLTFKKTIPRAGGEVRYLA